MIGIGASPGIAIGKAYVLKNDVLQIGRKNLREEEVPGELDRLLVALERSREQLAQYRDKVEDELGKEEGRIFTAHLLLLEDPEFIRGVKQTIQDHLQSATCAVQSVLNGYIQQFEDIQDDYLRERVVDIKDVGRIIISNLLDIPCSDLWPVDKDVILVSYELTPSEMARIDRTRILGFCTEAGGTTSHTAIMARSMEIPSVVGVRDLTSRVQDGDMIIVDGFSGEVLINPSQEQLEEYQGRSKRFSKKQEELVRLKEEPAKTLDGHRVKLYGNIGMPEEVEKVLEYGGEGVGLVRTESLYTLRELPPTEEEQYLAYRRILEGMKGAPVVIRTMDMGGDKESSCFQLPKEENPFLGRRGIRLSLNDPSTLKTQLRAILRASVYGHALIMYPMVSRIQEVWDANQILSEVKSQLDREGIPYDRELKVGIMVETPSVAITADIFSKYVDFFSIGANDLCQYTFAVDRNNREVSSLYDPLHPAMLRMIKGIVQAAHQGDIITGMCGEMAGDPLNTIVLLGLGLDELSMNPVSIPQVKRIIRNITMEEARALAERALHLENSEQVRAIIKEGLKDLNISA